MLPKLSTATGSAALALYPVAAAAHPGHGTAAEGSLTHLSAHIIPALMALIVAGLVCLAIVHLRPHGSLCRK